MNSHVIDSRYLKDLFGTEALRRIFSDSYQLQCWLDFEAALARAEAAVGLIPPEAAAEIGRAARAELIDLDALHQGVNFTGHPLISLVRQLADLCQGDAGRYVHWGATTQDVTDTGLMLQAKAAHGVILADLRGLAAGLADLARRERDTLMPGRTHGQHATPITFGFKVAVWLDEVRRHIERMEQLVPRVFVGEFAGASTTLASVGELGPEIQRRLLADLGLGVPAIGWHAARDRFAELGATLAMIAATMGKIAHEVILLQKSEVMELEEPHYPGKVGSSTMPHKRNPMICEGIVAQARLARALVPALLESMGTAEHERDWSAVHAEWAALPEICLLAGASVAQTLDVIKGLIVYPDNMRRNVDALHGLILSEAVMLRLGEHVGRQVAHDIVYEAAMAAFEGRRPLRDLLLEDQRVTQHLAPEQIDDLLRPEAYTGLAGVFVDRVAAELPYSRSVSMLIAPWHFSFTVSDIEQSIRFYRDVLGMELVHRQEQANEYTRRFVGYPDAHLKVAQFRIRGAASHRSGHMLELVQYVAPVGEKVDTQTKNTGTAHLAFEVDDIHAEYQRMAALGVRFRSAPIAIEAGINRGGFTCYFLDPDDITLEIIQPPAVPGQPSLG